MWELEVIDADARDMGSMGTWETEVSPEVGFEFEKMHVIEVVSIDYSMRRATVVIEYI